MLPRFRTILCLIWIGRGGGIRTPTRGFGDRWSAVKPTPLNKGATRHARDLGKSSVTPATCTWRPCLLDLLVRVMLAAERAEFAQLQPLRHRFLILHAG